MRKTTYLCVMMLLSMNVMAQIDTCDRNWNNALIENFDEATGPFEVQQGGEFTVIIQEECPD